MYIYYNNVHVVVRLEKIKIFSWFFMESIKMTEFRIKIR
jgi:hypothetical protein